MVLAPAWAERVYVATRWPRREIAKRTRVARLSVKVTRRPAILRCVSAVGITTGAGAAGAAGTGVATVGGDVTTGGSGVAVATAVGSGVGVAVGTGVATLSAGIAPVIAATAP